MGRQRAIRTYGVEDADLEQFEAFNDKASRAYYEADRILVLEDGKIADQGDHGQLLARCGRYRRMTELQMGGANG